MTDGLMSALAQIGDQYHKIILANLTRGTYSYVSAEKGQGAGEASAEDVLNLADFWRDEFDSEQIFPDDRNNVEKIVNPAYLRNFFQKYQGEEYYWVRYRKLVKGDYRPFRLEVFPAQDYADDNQSVYMFFMDLGGKLYRENSYVSDLLQSLSENYEGIYYVDFDKDVVMPYRMSPVINDKFGSFFRSNPSYEVAMSTYAKAMVSKKNLPEMLELSKVETVKKLLQNRRAYSHDFYVFRDGKEMSFRFKISKVNEGEELRRAVVGFAELTGGKQEDVRSFGSYKKVLVVTEDADARLELEELFADRYTVLTAVDGKAAMEVLEQAHQEISVVLTDLEMSVMDGYELMNQMKRALSLRDVPVIVMIPGSISEEERMDVENRSLEFGAADFVMKPFVPGVVLNRVRSLIRLRESTAMLNVLERDPLTGLYTKEFFFRKVEDYLEDHSDQKLLLWVSDVQGLKLINEKYGFDKGDAVLRTMAEYGVKFVPGFIFGGRVEGDKLAALVRDPDKGMADFLNIGPDDQAVLPVPNVIIKHGLYRIEGKVNISPQGMYDRAMLALQKIKSQYGVNVAEYNDELRQDILLKQMILGSADEALKTNQFQVYYQPKHDFRTGRTYGAEGLVRWVHPDIGFMNPLMFISLFEQNGFITKMDFYVWEEICKTIKKWEKEGIPVVPVSINVSRRDFEVPDLAGRIMNLVDSYEIPHGMVHVEVTESAYSDDPDRITETVKKLHDNGFVIEMDDFGTGYSSLMALSSMDLDVLKLDRSIIANDHPGSDKNILEFSMQLAKMLHLKTVAEGVETKEQMERISELGGDYIQGYYYSKPLPADEFAQYLVKKNAVADQDLH